MKGSDSVSNIAKIKQWDIANGKGIRTSVFFSGCPFHCKGCFNEDIQDFNVGRPFDYGVYQEIKDSMNEHISGLSILGGSPLCDRNCKDTYKLVSKFKQDFPDKNIWCWTGLTWKEIWSNSDYYSKVRQDILYNVDVLIDGRYIEEQRDLTLKWHGSKNQRVIDVQESLKQGKVVLYCE